MWKGYENALKEYLNVSIDVWKARGRNNTMQYEQIEGEVKMPWWIGKKDFHSSHRANLLRKDFEYYSKHGWEENPEDPYVWHDKENKWYKQHVGTGIREYYEIN